MKFRGNLVGLQSRLRSSSHRTKSSIHSTSKSKASSTKFRYKMENCKSGSRGLRACFANRQKQQRKH